MAKPIARLVTVYVERWTKRAAQPIDEGRIMRVFIAVDVNEEVLRKVGEAQKQLQSRVRLSDRGVKWVRPELMHLTLKFLGQVKDDEIREVCGVVEDVAGSRGSFELGIETIGYFGGTSARVLWVGTGAGSKELARLADGIDRRLAAIGFAKETRAFTGHLTLCRIKNGRDGFELAYAVGNFGPFSAGSTFIDAVTVYQSELGRSGPVYTALASYKLKE
jgi:2'-5' RNA ligase